jgi:hypothetical protein
VGAEVECQLKMTRVQLVSPVVKMQARICGKLLLYCSSHLFTMHNMGNLGVPPLGFCFLV